MSSLQVRMESRADRLAQDHSSTVRTEFLSSCAIAATAYAQRKATEARLPTHDPILLPPRAALIRQTDALGAVVERRCAEMDVRVQLLRLRQVSPANVLPPR